ncbi:YjbH domain-containing protein [Patescibacteria group bacterium]|nr:YjbH domain-containing protein [Patescibacteria group bacterium]
MRKVKMAQVVLIVVFLLFSLTIAYAQNHAATGILSTGSAATTGRGSGDNSEAGGTLATHSAYAEDSEESYFAGFSLVTNQTAPGGGEGVDGGIFAGMGMGKKGNSIEVTLTMADVSDSKDFLISAKYQFLSETPSRPAMAIGVEAINEIPEQLERSPYIVASKFFPKLKLPVIVSLGWGAGRFGDNIFGGIAFVITRRWNFIVEYDGMGGNVGTSFAVKVPEGYPSLVITMGFQDAFASEYDSTFTLGAGIRFH